MPGSRMPGSRMPGSGCQRMPGSDFQFSIRMPGSDFQFSICHTAGSSENADAGRHSRLNIESLTLHLSPQHSVLSPQSSALSPQSSVLSPQSSALSPQSCFLSRMPGSDFQFSICHTAGSSENADVGRHSRLNIESLTPHLCDPELPSVLSPQSSALSPQSSVLSTQSSVLSPQSSALSPQSSVLSPQPSVLSPQSSVLFSFEPFA